MNNFAFTISIEVGEKVLLGIKSIIFCKCINPVINANNWVIKMSIVNYNNWPIIKPFDFKFLNCLYGQNRRKLKTVRRSIFDYKMNWTPDAPPIFRVGSNCVDFGPIRIPVWITKSSINSPHKVEMMR